VRSHGTTYGVVHSNVVITHLFGEALQAAGEWALEKIVWGWYTWGYLLLSTPSFAIPCNNVSLCACILYSSCQALHYLLP